MVAPVEDDRESSDVIDGGRLSKAERKCARIGALVGVLFFVMLATWGQPWRMFDKGPFSSDFYDVQARSMVHGHMDIPADVARVEGVVVDGKVQIYFGVGPALIRTPLTGWTTFFDRRLSILSMSVAAGVLGMATARLLKRARALVIDAPTGRPWWFGLIAAGSILFTPVFFLASRGMVYHEALIWGCAAAVAGLDLVLRWWRVQTRRHFVEAVALATFAMSCRTTTGLAPALAIGLFGVVLAYRRQWIKAAIVIVGAVVALLGYVTFNWLRFRSFTTPSFTGQVWTLQNQGRQEFLKANDGSPIGFQFVPTTFSQYFSPIAVGWQRFFPFVNFGSRATPVGDVVFDGIKPTGSIEFGAPVFFVLAIIGSWWTVVRDRSREWSVLALASIAASIPTLMFGNIVHRYLVDFVPAVVILACPAVWVVMRRLQRWNESPRKSVFAAVAVVALLGALVQTGFALETRAFVLRPDESEARAFVDFQNMIDRQLFDGPPPLLQHVNGDELPTEGISDGSMVILDNCAGLYRFNGDNWQVLERKPGGGRRFIITGSIGEDPNPILQGSGWTVSARRTPEGVVFVYESTNGRRDESKAVALPEGELTFDAVADQAQISTISLTHEGSTVFTDSVLGASKARPSDGWTSTPGSAPLCESLLARLEN
ncbi:MAG: hypothetical protein F2561_03850 [Actinobacteria bacterium]|nr:hypothetical protein [Actinomycetota bacterium]